MPKVGIGFAAVILVAALLAACGNRPGEVAEGPCTGPGTGGPRVVYRAEPTPEEPSVTSAGIERTIEVMCDRARELGAHGALIVRLRDNRIVVRLGPGKDATQTASALGIPARLAFYDWDANVIGSPDRPLSLVSAVKRATNERPRAEASDVPVAGAEQQTVERFHGDQHRIEVFYDRLNNATGPSYYAFVGSRLLAGPESSCAGLGEALGRGRRWARGAISAGDIDAVGCQRRLAARRVLPSPGVVYVVPRGIRVVAAPRPGGGAPSTTLDGASPAPSAGYYILEDDAGLTSAQVDRAEPIKDEATGGAGLRLKFTDNGAAAYRDLTAGIVQMGLGAPESGSPRLAIALDGQLLSLTAIDPQASPQGLDPAAGVAIPGVGGEPRAKLLAKLIASGALPLDVRPAP